MSILGSMQLPKKLVGAEGFEPTTPASQTLCATRLRYAPTFRLTAEELLRDDGAEIPLGQTRLR
jgi:hypothetical protein